MQTGSILEVTYQCILSAIQQINSGICYDQTGHALIKQTTIGILERCLEDTESILNCIF